MGAGVSKPRGWTSKREQPVATGSGANSSAGGALVVKLIPFDGTKADDANSSAGGALVVERIPFDKAGDALREHAERWGRCAWEDTSSQGDKNWLVSIRDNLRGTPRPNEWSKLCDIDDVDRKTTTTGNTNGIVLQLLHLLRGFVSSGAGGLRPATQSALIVRKLVLTVNKGVPDSNVSKMEERKGAWLAVIKEIRKLGTGLPKPQRKGIPLAYFDSILGQIETIVCAIPDPDFKQKAAIVGVKILVSVANSIATMKLDTNLMKNLGTGLNMTAGKNPIPALLSCQTCCMILWSLGRAYY